MDRVPPPLYPKEWFKVPQAAAAPAAFGCRQSRVWELHVGGENREALHRLGTSEVKTAKSCFKDLRIFTLRLISSILPLRIFANLTSLTLKCNSNKNHRCFINSIWRLQKRLSSLRILLLHSKKSFRGLRYRKKKKSIITDGDNKDGLESSQSYFLLNLSQEAMTAAYTKWWTTLLSPPATPPARTPRRDKSLHWPPSWGEICEVNEGKPAKDEQEGRTKPAASK